MRTVNRPRSRELVAERPAPASRANVRALPRRRGRLLRYLSCLRLGEIVLLQAPPFFGVLLALRDAEGPDPIAFALVMAGNVLLMAHVFLLNDWAGQKIDLADPTKALRVFTARGVTRREVEWISAALLAGGLALFATVGAVTFWLGAAIALLSVLYSAPRFDWKSLPILGSVAHLSGGIFHFLLGYSLCSAIDARGLALAGFFALTFVAGHLTQEVRDHQGDGASGVFTNAVAFGPRRAFIAGLVMFTAAYLLLAAIALGGLLERALVAVVLFYPIHLRWSLKTLASGLDHAAVTRLQARYRLLFGIIGVAIVTSVVAGL